MLQIFTMSPSLFLGLSLGLFLSSWVSLSGNAIAVETLKTTEISDSTFWLAETMMAPSQAALPKAISQIVIKDLAKQTKIPVNQIKVKSAVPKTWPDGCLGLAKPDQICTQAMVQGWQVILESGKKAWIYRTNQTGSNIRLQP